MSTIFDVAKYIVEHILDGKEKGTLFLANKSKDFSLNDYLANQGGFFMNIKIVKNVKKIQILVYLLSITTLV